VFAAVLLTLSVAHAAARPNFVVIVADDLGYGDVGAYGSRAIATPHIDRLAAEGIRLTDFHSSDSVCTPSRAGLLTGRYAKRMGLDVPLMPGNMGWGEWLLTRAGYAIGRVGLMDLATEGGASGLASNELTLAEALGAAGYATAMVGKWHLGDYVQAPEFDPRRHGFDRYLGVPYSNDMRPFPLVRDGRVLEGEIQDQGQLTRLYTEEAVAFIEEERDAPFFLYFAHTFPHRPLFASESFRGRSAGGLYGDVVEELDWSVGQVLAALERRGIAGDTLVVFTSDNGPWYQGSPGGLRGRKGQSYEGGHRVPMLARWPGSVPAGAVSHAPTMNIDLFPTVLAFAGVDPPADRVIDGRDIGDVLTRPGAPSPHEHLFFYHQGKIEGVRQGRWKFLRELHHYVWPNPLNRVTGFLARQTAGPLPLLFDLDLDPDESYDLSANHPDVVARLSAAIEEFESSLEANRKGLD
jgi:arylsulfatase A